MNTAPLKRWFLHYFGGLYNRSGDHHIFLLAGGLAFSLFVCIIPLILIIFAIIGRVLEMPSISQDIEQLIDRVIPYKDYAAFVKKTVFSRVEEFRIFKNLAGLAGLVGLFFAASGLFSSMRTILNMVYRARSTASAIIGKLRDFGLVLLVLFYFLLSTTILPVLNIVEGLSERAKLLESFRLSFVGDLLLWFLSFGIILLFFLIIYWLVPQVKLPRKAVLVSALSAAILWTLAKELFGLYITNVVTLKRIYGAYALLVITAFWVYYTSIVFIIAAEVGQLYRERVATPQVNE